MDYNGKNRVKCEGEWDMRWVRRGAATAALAVLGVSLVSLLLLGRCCAPAADDFGYGAPVHFALEAGLGLPGVLGAIWENLCYTYQNWQGTFGSVLLFSIQPGAFSWNAYPITVVVMLAVIILPVFLTLGALPTESRAWTVLLGSVISLLSVQYLPSPAEGIFWWNGAAHYLVFWCLGVVMTLYHIRLEKWNRRGVRYGLRLILAGAGCFFVGGGNYSTALVFVLVSATFTVLALIRRVPRPAAAANILMTLSAAAGLVVSMAAPGNAVRQAGLEQMSPLTAILSSFQQAGQDIAAMTDGTILAALLLTTPLFLLSVRGSGYRFQMPLLVLAGSFCAFAALYTPPLYAMGVSEVPRMENLFWLAYVFLIFGNTFYLAGWLSRRLSPDSSKKARRILGVLAGVGGAVLVAALCFHLEESCGYLAWADLHSPELGVYLQERESRLALTTDHVTPPPRFTAMSGYPTCFPVSQLLTWSSDVLVDGSPADLPCYHACGGEVTYVGLEQALEFFDCDKPLSDSDFSATFHIGGQNCVPLREFCNLLGYSVAYDVPSDTILILTVS